MRVDVKFCGLTRAADAALGAALGAGYLGVVFAESPRRVDAAGARAVFAPLQNGSGPQRVGVFGAAAAGEIARTAQDILLDVVQLSGDPSAADVLKLRELFAGEIWATRRITGSSVPHDLGQLADVADRVLLDARPLSGAALGGTGTAFDWEALAPHIAPLRPSMRLVVAGGLTPGNVRRAIELLAPNVVDVSSGVEKAPGIKDEQLMRAFVRAAAGADR